MSGYSAFVAAIQNRSVIEFRDSGGYQRIGEPHLLGVCTETGICELEILQTDGATSQNRGRLPQWRRFAVEDLWDLRTTAIPFMPRDEFNAWSPRWSRVIVSVSDNPADVRDEASPRACKALTKSPE